MRVKGSALRSSMNFLRENFPPEAVDHVLDQLSEEKRGMLMHPIPSSEWFAADILYDLMQAMTTATHERPEKLFNRLGRQSCDDSLDTVYRVFVKMRSPAFLLKHVSQVWHNFYDEGQMILLSSTLKSAHLRLQEARIPNPAMCVRITGWMERAVDLSGGKESRIAHTQCVHHGGPFCEWQAEWK